MQKTRKNAGVFKTLALGAVSAFAIHTVLLAGPAIASEFDDKIDSATINFDVEAQPLQSALLALSEQANIVVVAPVNMTKGKMAAEVAGLYSVRESLSRLLSDSGLQYEIDDAGSVFIRDQSSDAHLAGFKKISMYTDADYEANLGVYESDDGSNDTSAFELDEIIVTASRRAQKLQDVPMAITSVNPEKFIAAGLTSIEDILDYTPGVNVNNAGNVGQGNITMRGVGQESSIPVTAIYIDDVPLTNPTPFANGSILYLDGLLGDLERVEVIKGPQGTLYGASAMGGIIRYITKDPALEEMRGNASVDLSTTKHGGMSQLYRGMISTPLVEDKLGITVSGFYNDRSGFMDRLDPATGELADKDYNSAELYGVSFTSLWQMSDAASLRASVVYQKTKVVGDNAILFNAEGDLSSQNVTLDRSATDSLVLVQNDANYQVTDVDPGFNNVEYTKADLTFKYAFDWAEFVSVTGYAKTDNPTFADNVTSTGPFVDFILGAPAGTTTSVPLFFTSVSEKFVQELRLSSLNNDTFEWQVGLFYTKDDSENVQNLVALPQDIDLTDVFLGAEYEEKAAFANLTYYVTPNFDVTAGIRYSEPTLNATFDIGGLLVAPLLVEDVNVAENVTTYRFNARWRVEDNLSLYASVASGYRPAFAGIPLVDQVTGQTSSPVVDSDSLWSYEIGAKGSVFDGRFTYDVALWAMKWDDFQSNLILNGLNVATNAGVSQSSEGFEGTFNAFVTDQLRVETTVTYTSARIDADSEGLGAAEGDRTLALPKWAGSVRATYDYTINDIDASVGFGVRYVGNYATTYLGDGGRIGSGFGRQFPVQQVVLADLSAAFTRDNLTLSLYATNLFDNYVYTSSSVALDGIGGVNASASVARPRTIGATLGITF